MTMFYKAAGILLAIYLLIVLAAWLGQRRLMYAPDATRHLPASVGLSAVEEHEMQTPDGAMLVTWRATIVPGKPVILYFHGNAGGLASRANRIRRYQATGIGLVMMSYRSYSGSTGTPSEANNLRDAILLFDTLLAEDIKPADIYLYGESLGSGVAVQLAAARSVAGLILDAPYSSMVDMAARTYPFLPVRPLLSDRYDSVQHIARVKAPVLVLHGAEDELIPVAMGQALHAAAGLPKELVVFPSGRHTDLDEHGAVEAVTRWISGLRAVRR